MNALPFSKVTFSTADSGSSLDTVLRVRWLPTTTPPCDDDSAGLLKSVQYFTNSAILGVGIEQLSFTAPAFGDPGVTLRNGLIYNSADLTMVKETRFLTFRKGLN